MINSQVIYPIIADGDVIGSVILLSKESNTKMLNNIGFNVINIGK